MELCQVRSMSCSWVSREYAWEGRGGGERQQQQEHGEAEAETHAVEMRVPQRGMAWR